MNDSETIKRVLLSVLSAGNNSPMFDQFYNICLNFSITTICVNKNKRLRDELTYKLDCTVKDLACECIADIFEIKEGKFIRFNNYFGKKFPEGIQHIHPDKLKVHLAALIKSKVNQNIYALKEDLGDIYPKVKKSLDTFLSRNKDMYERFMLNGVKFIRFNHSCKIDFSLPQIEKQVLISKMLSLDVKNFFIATLIPEVFKILDCQHEFCKAVNEKLLLELLKEFYLIKINDTVRNNVEYINNEGIDDIIILN